MYRPTVRYPDAFKDYVDNLFRYTKLDRNQIFRLALFSAAHSEVFLGILRKHSFNDAPLPSPEWTLDDETCWKGNHYSGSAYKQPPAKEIIRLKDNGGIKIILS